MGDRIDTEDITVTVRVSLVYGHGPGEQGSCWWCVPLPTCSLESTSGATSEEAISRMQVLIRERVWPKARLLVEA